MPCWQLTIDVDAPASSTWDLVGDPTSVPRWYPKYQTAEVAGGQRILRNADGGELEETLDERDEAARRYSYSVVSGGARRLVPRHLRGAGARGRAAAWCGRWRPSRRTRRWTWQARLTPTQEDALRRIKEIVETEG